MRLVYTCIWIVDWGYTTSYSLKGTSSATSMPIATLARAQATMRGGNAGAHSVLVWEYKEGEG